MSPIKGVSDIVRLPRLGKIRLGIKDPERGFPRATDYFVCPPEVQAVFGEKPAVLTIMFPTEDETLWAQQYWRYYSQTRGLICKGDGETAVALIDREAGDIAGAGAKYTELKETSCSGNTCPKVLAKQCRHVLNLQFLLPDVPGLGIWQVDTGSFFGIVNVNSGIRMVRVLCGRVAMIPLQLSLIKQEVQVEGKKKKVHVLQLTAAVTLGEVQRLAQRPVTQALLPPPPDLEPDGGIEPEEEAEERAESPQVAASDELGWVSEPVPPATEEQKENLRQIGKKKGRQLTNAEEDTLTASRADELIRVWGFLPSKTALPAAQPILPATGEAPETPGAGKAAQAENEALRASGGERGIGLWGDRASQRQINAINTLGQKKGKSLEDIVKELGKAPEELTEEEARNTIIAWGAR